MSALVHSLAATVSGVPPQLATVMLAALPVLELRGALPVALELYRLPVWQAVLFSVTGNLLPVYFLLTFLERASVWLRPRSALADRVLTWLFVHTRLRLAAKVDRYGVWALALFVAVPLPVTGAWTGSIAAFVFGLPKRASMLSISAGVLFAAAVVTGVVHGLTGLAAVWAGRL
ncbi:MAG: ligand-binding protein SH3 [Candidatus Andersenbacteria bacterium CG10_big_fil_rev_8_21_14_0_10_54_11]|uniref:Ligand-binding protein SH3 n=1 Tax=Candidatus Andersenbacteria bacterium CG10_big_fil_rev_8_21_14_0_10_54_11 TaxID=1974485 RepID=A0A2M6WYY6_9BACT|nr:MAG: ligand-binding protein SH3 [Candidatus Andersenbacteria bacterium CG10_big_fil_rev_8_21_14_0_10_54_11]